MPSPRSPASRVTPGAARTAPWATAASTTRSNGRGCASGGSARSWRSGGGPPGGARELAKRRTPHGGGLGVYRWVVERTISWFHQFRRLRVRFEPRDDIHQGLCNLAEILITFRFLVLYGLV